MLSRRHRSWQSHRVATQVERSIKYKPSSETAICEASINVRHWVGSMAHTSGTGKATLVRHRRTQSHFHRTVSTAVEFFPTINAVLEFEFMKLLQAQCNAPRVVAVVCLGTTSSQLVIAPAMNIPSGDTSMFCVKPGKSSSVGRKSHKGMNQSTPRPARSLLHLLCNHVAVHCTRRRNRSSSPSWGR